MSRKIILDTETEKKMCNMSYSHTHKQIGLTFGYSEGFVNTILKKHNLHHQPRYRLNKSTNSIDEKYFYLIDSAEKAYWLGYLSADGCVNKQGSKCTLISKDIETIEKFKNAVSSQHKISINERKDKRTQNIYRWYSIQVTNRRFISYLIKYGITSTKSDILKMPSIQESLYSYFFAGLFDGDGSLGLRNKNKIRVSLISTKELLFFLQAYLINNFNAKVTKFQKVSIHKENVWKLLLYKDSKQFLDWIYSDREFKYLTRKYEKYKNLC